MTLSDYTTEELERLTTLTEATAKPGEFLRDYAGGLTFRLVDAVAFIDGKTRCNLTASLPERRVTSFTDATELDPPQADMLAELARRKAPVFKVGELVKWEGQDCPVFPIGPPSCHPDCRLTPEGYQVHITALRPATDAEVAAYHRAHCQPKVEPVKPVVISNATHAGQWVKFRGQPCRVLRPTDALRIFPIDGLVVLVDDQGYLSRADARYLTIIDPPVWSK